MYSAPTLYFFIVASLLLTIADAINVRGGAISGKTIKNQGEVDDKERGLVISEVSSYKEVSATNSDPKECTNSPTVVGHFTFEMYVTNIKDSKKCEEYHPAIREAIQKSLHEVNAIMTNLVPEQPTFLSDICVDSGSEANRRKLWWPFGGWGGGGCWWCDDDDDDGRRRRNLLGEVEAQSTIKGKVTQGKMLRMFETELISLTSRKLAIIAPKNVCFRGGELPDVVVLTSATDKTTTDIVLETCTSP